MYYLVEVTDMTKAAVERMTEGKVLDIDGHSWMLQKHKGPRWLAVSVTREGGFILQNLIFATRLFIRKGRNAPTETEFTAAIKAKFGDAAARGEGH